MMLLITTGREEERFWENNNSLFIFQFAFPVNDIGFTMNIHCQPIIIIIIIIAGIIIISLLALTFSYTLFSIVFFSLFFLFLLILFPYHYHYSVANELHTFIFLSFSSFIFFHGNLIMSAFGWNQEKQIISESE